MFAVCIESSHKKGMGHFFRMLNFTRYLEGRNEKFMVLVNEDEHANRLLIEMGLPFEIVDLNDETSDWETAIIERYGIQVWLNDRLETAAGHARNVQKNGVCLATIDDLGEGAALSDIHFATMPCVFEGSPKGKRVFGGIRYLILNKDIDKHKRKRSGQNKILITLGGSDTYGVTIKVVKILDALGKTADIIIGPSFGHEAELMQAAGSKFVIKRYTSSLMEEFEKYDLAITGGGITPFEANASGLPCIVIASEAHEIKNGIFLDSLGSSVYAGFHEIIDEAVFVWELDIGKMSEIGLSSFDTAAIGRIYEELKEVVKL